MTRLGLRLLFVDLKVTLWLPETEGGSQTHGQKHRHSHPSPPGRCGGRCLRVVQPGRLAGGPFFWLHSSPNDSQLSRSHILGREPGGATEATPGACVEGKALDVTMQ